MHMHDVQPEPIATLEWLGTLTIVFSSIHGGHELVFCGKSKEKDDLAIVQHTCLLCRVYGHSNCPYIKKALYLLMIYWKQRLRHYKIVLKKAEIHKGMNSIPIPGLSELKNPKES
jgi:hypothetical protein